MFALSKIPGHATGHAYKTNIYNNNIDHMVHSSIYNEFCVDTSRTV